MLDNAHLDIQTPYLVGGGFSGIYQTIGENPIGTFDDSHLNVNPNNRLNLSASELAGFDFIGATPGEDFWLLPQADRQPGQPYDYLYLGVSADATADAARDEMVAWNPGDPRGASTSGKWIEWRLRDVRSPTGNGEFSTFQLGTTTGTRVFFDTTDGIGNDGGLDDRMWELAGNHSHYNWAFTEQGIWEIDIQAFTVADLDRLPGDANLDGQVNLSDFLALRRGFGSFGSWANGDFNGSGNVDLSDFLILRRNFGAGAGGGPGDGAGQLASFYQSIVPEPGALSIMAASSALLLRRRRHGAGAA
jgi:hypothetical protein